MSKDTTKKGDIQENNLFSFSDVLPDKKIQVDFNAPDLSSNGGLVLVGLMTESIARKVARLIPDHRNQLFVQYSYEEMVCQRVGQIRLHIKSYSTLTTRQTIASCQGGFRTSPC